MQALISVRIVDPLNAILCRICQPSVKKMCMTRSIFPSHKVFFSSHPSLDKRLVEHDHILLNTVRPKAIPKNVAMAIPKMPTRIEGTSKVLHPLAVAIPPAVVGPPTLAFDASKISRISNLNNLPTPMIMPRWTAIWAKLKKNNAGAVLITLCTLPFAPTVAKKICTNPHFRSLFWWIPHKKYSTPFVCADWPIPVVEKPPIYWLWIEGEEALHRQ